MGGKLSPARSSLTNGVAPVVFSSLFTEFYTTGFNRWSDFTVTLHALYLISSLVDRLSYVTHRTIRKRAPTEHTASLVITVHGASLSRHGGDNYVLSVLGMCARGGHGVGPVLVSSG